jgi:hypothetical protein
LIYCNYLLHMSFCLDIIHSGKNTEIRDLALYQILNTFPQKALIAKRVC